VGHTLDLYFVIELDNGGSDLNVSKASLPEILNKTLQGCQEHEVLGERLTLITGELRKLADQIDSVVSEEPSSRLNYQYQ